MLSIPHLIIIFLVALVVLGPEKLPEVARVLGKVMSEFRKVTTDFRSALETEMNEIDRQTREKERLAREASARAAATPVAALPEAAKELTVEARPPATDEEGAGVANVDAPTEPAAEKRTDPSTPAAVGPVSNGESHPA